MSHGVNIDMTFMDDIDTLRYKKKKSSDKSKAARKSKHQHVYIDVLIKNKDSIEDDGIFGYRLGKRCKICGKVIETKFMITSKQPDGTHIVLKNSEVLKLYRHLEIVDR